MKILMNMCYSVKVKNNVKHKFLEERNAGNALQLT